MTEQESDKRNNRIGWLASVGVHSLVFLVLFFIVAWRAPNPPLPEYGIELNFGLDDQGTGDVQPQTPVGNDANGEEKVVEEKSQQQQTEAQTTKPEDTKDKDAGAVASEEQVASKIESPVKLKEQKKEQKDVPKEVVKESATREKVKETKVEEKKEVATSVKGDPGNQGDDKKAVGDKGSEQGKLDAKALYGTPGGGGGGNGMDLQMAGWAWADQPNIPDLPDNENGRVVFEIECDENGDITGITTLERSLSPKAEQLLKDEIRRNSLQKISGGRAPERSKGKIIFVLKTR